MLVSVFLTLFLSPSPNDLEPRFHRLRVRAVSSLRVPPRRRLLLDDVSRVDVGVPYAARPVPVHRWEASDGTEVPRGSQAAGGEGKQIVSRGAQGEEGGSEEVQEEEEEELRVAAQEGGRTFTAVGGSERRENDNVVGLKRLGIAAWGLLAARRLDKTG